MKNLINTRYAIITIAIGFFLSCTGSKFTADKLIDDGNYEQALVEISAEIEKNPSPYLYFQKGKVHGLIASDASVSERAYSYEEMSSSFDSISVYQTSSHQDWQTEADSLSNYYWNLEHQNGLKAYEEDSQESILTAISHFKNAVSIDPSSIESYKSLSIAQYNNGNIDGALESLKAAEMLPDATTDVFESLGFLYLEKGDPEQSIIYYKKADQDPLKNKNIAFGLVNAYISQGKTYEAISFLDELVNEFPNDAKLHNVYGTQLYEQVSELFSNLKSAYSVNDTSTTATLSVEIEGVSEKAENELIKAYQMDSSNLEFVESLAVFYNNMSGNYFSIYQVAFQSDKDTIEAKALSLTDFAITYYEKLQELNPSSSYSGKIDNLKKLKESWTNR
ncbi:tetratricopeptide repeat protein [bacterium]|nr:tetratricopeptide repeat protein [Balneola sp.]MBR9916938.1 tetratricopeptide repeat protein [bacterium]